MQICTLIVYKGLKKLCQYISSNRSKCLARSRHLSGTWRRAINACAPLKWRTARKVLTYMYGVRASSFSSPTAADTGN